MFYDLNFFFLNREKDILKHRHDKDNAKKTATQLQKQKIIETVETKKRDYDQMTDSVMNLYYEIIEKVCVFKLGYQYV